MMFVIGLVLLASTGSACSVTTIYAKDHTCNSRTLEALGVCETVGFTARTMELNLDMPYSVQTVPKNTYWPADFPQCAPGTPWNGTYNFVSISTDLTCENPGLYMKPGYRCLFGTKEEFGGKKKSWVFDGMNEHGLTVSALAFTHSMYEKQDDPENPIKVCYTDFPAWALSQFKTIEALKKAMTSDNFVMMGDLPNHFGFQSHWSVQDATGADVVIEYNYHNPGVATFYENGVGVMTNNPDFEWHVMNLNNYANVNHEETHTEQDIIAKNFVWTRGGKPMNVPVAIGAGANMLGIPGDITPSGRFVKLFFTKQFAVASDPPTTKEGLPNSALTHAQNIIKSAWIARGVEPVTHTNKTNPEKDVLLHGYTQWTVIKVPKTRKFYYQGYADTRLKMIDLSKLTQLDYTSDNRDYFMKWETYKVDETSKYHVKPKRKPAKFTSSRQIARKIERLLKKLIEA